VAGTPGSGGGSGIAAAAGAVLALLSAQEVLFAEQAALATELRRALAAADSPSLADLLARQETLTARQQQCEAARLLALSELAPALGVEPSAMTLSRLCDAVADAAPEVAGALRGARTRLRAQAEQLIAASKQDARLVEACLGSATRSLQHLIRAVDAAVAAPQYAPAGRRSPPPALTRLTDRRA
jgi:hypothetical protein